MSLIIIKIVGSLSMAIASLFIARNILDNKEKILSLTNVIGIFFMILPVCFLYQEKYNSFVFLLTFIIYIVVFKIIYKITVPISVVISSFALISITLVDLLITSLELSFVSYHFMRTHIILTIFNNIVIGILAIFISYIPFLKKKIKLICSKIYNNNYLSLVIFATIIIIVISLLYYNITSVFKLNIYYTVTSISIVIFIFLSYFYIDEKNNYQKLNDEYNSLFNYVQNFENWIDDEQMYRHELKNNLSIIRNMTNNKKIIEKIDEMLKFSIIIDDKEIEDLKNIPKGGLKGLLYYKTALTKNKKVKMIIEVSPKVTTIIKKLEEKKLRQLCIVLGIYLDNALEAAATSKKKTVTLEVYKSNNNLTFTISNSYKHIIPIKDMQKKGFTTKGKNHGKGLYFVSKVLNKEKWIDTSQIFLNQYFIQKIFLK